jgi:hypothetical protein
VLDALAAAVPSRREETPSGIPWGIEIRLSALGHVSILSDVIVGRACSGQN